MPIVAGDVVRTVELEPFVFESGDSLHFRIEVQRRAGEPLFRTRVWRVESFHMRPTWPDGSRESRDDVLISDDIYTSPEHVSPTADAALEHVLAELERQFDRSTSA
jgi:hypothetical protein